MIRVIQELLSSLWELVLSFWKKLFAPSILLDTGVSVRLGKQIAEGGFSFVFEATDESNGQMYALKRIYLGDRETLSACQTEAGVHRALRHANLMPLLGMCVQSEKRYCYMMFPYLPLSLRSIVNRHVQLPTSSSNGTLSNRLPSKPFSEVVVFQIFCQLVSAVVSMHEAGFTHRDIKLENVLMRGNNIPVLMDFGSVGPLTQSLAKRREVSQIAELASQHTTFPYRPPELLEGGVRTGDEPDLDYRLVDVWSLGCTLFAMCYGASPFECEFRYPSGELRIVDCTQLKILGDVPKPPPQSDVATWYSTDVDELVQMMLIHDRTKRTDLETIHVVVQGLVKKLGGKVPKPSPIGWPNDATSIHRSFV